MSTTRNCTIVHNGTGSGVSGEKVFVLGFYKMKTLVRKYLTLSGQTWLACLVYTVLTSQQPIMS